LTSRLAIKPASSTEQTTPEPAKSPFVRPVEAADIPAVGQLFQRVFRKSKEPPSQVLLAYLHRVFVAPSENAAVDGGVRSLVHQSGDGEINGFIGIIAMPFLVDGVKRQAAFAGSLMVDEDGNDPMAGARLLRGFQSGPQDITLSETANEISQGMWRRLRGLVLTEYSLEWLRIFKPASFAVSMLAMRKPVLSRLRFAAIPMDWVLGRLLKSAPKMPGAAYSDHAIDDDTFVSLIERFTAHHAIRPDWSAMNVKEMLVDARQKSRYGAMVQHVVTRSNTPIGLFVYHAKPNGICHVLQIAAAPGRMQDVVDCLFAHAAERGMAGLRGRTQPALLEALLPKGCHFLHRSATVALSRDKDLMARLAGGDAFINGLAGETWIRLIGDEFT
jgi:hypothetical protein